MVVLEKDKDNKELETLYSQCISLYPNRKQVCRLNAYSSLKTSNIYSQETRDYFTSTINMKEKMCNMEDEDTTAQEEIATKETKEEAKPIASESNDKFAEAVEKFIKKEWGESDWEIGFIQCMIGHAASLSKEVKEVVIEYGPEKAFGKISNQEDEIAYNKAFQACEKKLVKSAKYYKTMAFFLTDTSCIIKSKKRLKYNKEAATKVRKAVADFFITTFEITSPL